MIHYIYALTDPDTGEARYIGRTTNPLARYMNHTQTWSTPGKEKREWTNDLKRQGKAPGMVVIDRCATRDEAKQRETELIVQLKEAGVNLLNQRHKGCSNPYKGRKYRVLWHNGRELVAK